jgi:predicted ArsR family transcriptional regulator
MTDEPILALETRRRIVALVRDYPGLHLREAARQLDTSVALVEYHVPFLVQSGLVRIESRERYQRLFPVTTDGETGEPLSKEDRRWLGTLRERLPLQVVLHLLSEDGEARHKDMVESLEMGKSKLTFHLKKLEKAGLVEKTSDGAFRLTDAKRITRLLLTHKPLPDIQQEFADLWLGFYGR